MSGRKRKFEIISPDLAPTLKIEVDWGKCFICQSTDFSAAIISPFKSPCFLQSPEKLSYYKVAASLKHFQQIRNALPAILQKTIESYKTENDLALDPIKDRAIFHKTCMTRCDSHKLQRFKSSTEPSADSSTCETPNSLRSSSNAKNFTGKCFFCNQTAEDDVLHQCQTLHGCPCEEDCI